MTQDFDQKFIKSLIICLWVLPTLYLFYFLDSAIPNSYIVFLLTIFGCNYIYDFCKKIIAAPKVKLELAKKSIYQSLTSTALFFLSFVGLYFDIAKILLPTWGIILIWLPCYISSLWLLAEAEKNYKIAFKSNN
jgi:hypothetical protein